MVKICVDYCRLAVFPRYKPVRKRDDFITTLYLAYFHLSHTKICVLLCVFNILCRKSNPFFIPSAYTGYNHLLFIMFYNYTPYTRSGYLSLLGLKACKFALILCTCILIFSRKFEIIVGREK